MAKIVGSVVVGEVVNRTTSFIISKHKERLTTWEGIERLEMAHIKMEAAFDVSGRWQTTDVSLLRWRRKLRRTADDCDAALHRWKLRALEDEAARERLARAPFRRRVAHAVVSFIRALLVRTRGNDEVSQACAAVQRFERLASGSVEFLRCVEFSSASRRCCLVGPTVRKLGKHASYSPLHGAQRRRRRGLGGTQALQWLRQSQGAVSRKITAAGMTC
jgi:hypothetical protein